MCARLRFDATLGLWTVAPGARVLRTALSCMMIAIGEYLDRAVHNVVRYALVIAIVGIVLAAIPAIVVTVVTEATQSVPLRIVLDAIQIVLTAPASAALVWIVSPQRTQAIGVGRAFARGMRYAPKVFVLFIPFAIVAVVAVIAFYAPGIAFVTIVHLGPLPVVRIVTLFILFGPSTIAIVLLVALLSLAFNSAISAIEFEAAGPFRACGIAIGRIFATGHRRRSIAVALCAFAPGALIATIQLVPERAIPALPPWSYSVVYELLDVAASAFAAAVALEYDADLRRRREGLDLEAAIAAIG